jgi:arylsulfatase A-like enzyme
VPLRLRRFDRDVGLVLFGFIVLIALENLAVGLGYREQFVGSWEMAAARYFLSPLALALTLPVAVAVVALGRLALYRRAWAVAIVGGIGGGAVGVGVTTGRHFANMAVRVPFVALLVAAAAGASFVLARLLPRMRAREATLAGIAATALLWLADAFVLPRLYPAFHLALWFLVLGACGLSTRWLRSSPRARPLAACSLIVALLSAGWGAYAAPRLRSEDNLRRILLEHAPILGRSVIVASVLAPPVPVDDEDNVATTTLTQLRDRTGARSLDWRGRDLVLLTIDALRADHVSAYGYARKTTPNIDALAARGVRFEHAYCPTPHTSYSIASMMTGKYLKPILALDVDDDSETWAFQLRRYGYRTAAFYPPAVFFIDEHRFRAMRDDSLSFEYAKEEFVTRDLRRKQVEDYLNAAPRDKPLFLWVHLFEPHEPYEMHADHPFSGEPRVDAYDSEVAEADASVGDIVELVEAHRPPGAVLIVSADHGEEHDDHGGRYHGTTVYEEQVRVPLVVVAPGVTPHVVEPPVQTIDLLPTSLAAFDVPTPPRLRGRDLGPAIAGTAAATDEGIAFAETDDYTLVARGHERLVCARKIASCTLFDVSHDPLETQPVVDRPARVAELKKLTAALERENGKLEVSSLPDALRRGLQGDRDAAEDIAPLLDDAAVEIRRTAARCAFQLKAPEIAPQLRRALGRDEDAGVRQWSALALVRMGEGASGGAQALVDSLLKASDLDLRTAAALALAERGDGRGEADLLARWTTAFAPDTTEPGEPPEARELLKALATIHARNAAPVLLRSLTDVRLRPHVVEALDAIGDPRAKEPLLRLFAEERYVHLRPAEARALLHLGARDKLLPALARFAGTPEPMLESVSIAHEARLLTPDHGGTEWAPFANRAHAKALSKVEAHVRFPKAGPARLLVLGNGDAPLTGSLNGAWLPEAQPVGDRVYVVPAGEVAAGDVRVALSSPSGIVAAWLVPLAAEIRPPPPQAWAPTAASTRPDGGL